MLYDTPKMKKLIEQVDPYLNDKLELVEDAPSDVVEALNEYRRLSKEQEEFELSLS